MNRSDYLKKLGISALRLNNIFLPRHEGQKFDRVSTLLDLDEALGTPEDFIYLADMLHARNISLILDLPVYPYLKKLKVVHKSKTPNSNTKDKNDSFIGSDIKETSNIIDDDDDQIARAISLWSDRGADGFYLLVNKNLNSLTNIT